MDGGIPVQVKEFRIFENDQFFEEAEQ